MYEKQREFIRLAHEVDRICSTSVSWKTKYELIFSDELLDRLDALADFNYYDPDTSYEEDVLAFRRAVMDKARELEEVTRECPHDVQEGENGL